MAPKRVFPVGTVSHGTLRAQDLIESFADALRTLGSGRYVGQIETCESEAKLLAEVDALDIGADDFADCDLLEDLTQALEERAPAYLYFGAIEGDGSDFGFWPCTDQIDEDTHSGDLASGDELPDDGELLDHPAFLVFSDHGNLTYYERDDSRQWVEVWSCV